MQFHRQLKASPKLVVPLTESEFRMVIELYDNSHFEGARDALILGAIHHWHATCRAALTPLDAIDRNNQQLKVVGKRNKTKLYHCWQKSFLKSISICLIVILSTKPSRAIGCSSTPRQCTEASRHMLSV